MEGIRLRMMELKQQGYCCTQIMLLMALEEQGGTNRELIRAAGGLCYGVGMSGEVCGSLSGGACLIALYTGKGSEEEEMDEQYPLLMTELSKWFAHVVGEECGGIRCDDILSRYPDRSRCGLIVMATYIKIMELLDARGIDRRRGKASEDKHNEPPRRARSGAYLP